MQGRRWVFTLNNPLGLLDPEGMPGVKYMIYQRERGAETGTEHFQGYVVFSTNKKLAGVKKIIGGQPHVETAKGTHEQCISYCSKDETRVEGPWEYGDRRACGQGARTDLQRATDMVRERVPMRRIFEEAPEAFVKFHRGLEKAARFYPPARTKPPEVEVFYGPPGTGKSTAARDENPEYWKKPVCNKWFDGYDGQPTVIIDEFKGWIPLTTLNDMCDVAPCQVESKGGMVHMAASKFVLTTNHMPDTWYQEAGEKFEAFKRRVTKWSYFPKLGERVDFKDWDAFFGAVPRPAEALARRFEPVMQNEWYNQ